MNFLCQNLDLIFRTSIIILQVMCAHIAFKAYVDIKSNGASHFWWYMWVAFVLMAIRRVTAILPLYGLATIDLGYMDDVILPFIISALLYIGMIKVYFFNLRKKKQFDDQTKKLKQLTEKLSRSPYVSKSR